MALAASAVGTGTLSVANAFSDRVVRLTSVAGPRGEQFVRDVRTGGMWLVSRDYSTASTWVYGSDNVAQASFRNLIQGARVFLDGVWWDTANFPP